MSKFPLRVLLLCYAIAWTNLTFGANYYFSTGKGNDSRSFAEAQNPETPWQSLDKFNQIFSQLQPGDAVYFERGEVFYGRLLLNRSGTQAAPITIGAYGSGPDPVISGFDTVNNWTSLGNGIYQSEALSTGSTVNMVVIDNINYPKGRYPNAGYLMMESISGNVITNQQLSGGPNWNGAQLAIRTSHWTIERVKVSSHSGSTVNYSGSTSYSPKQGYGFFVQDHINTLDQFGEWYYDPGSRKVSVFLGSQGPAGIGSVKVAALDVLLEVRASDIIVDGLNFEGANQYAVANLSHHVERLQVKNAKMTYSGIDGVFLHGAYHTTLENNQVWHSNNCGVKLFYCPNTTLRSNDIRHSGMQPGMGADGDGGYVGVLSEATGFVAEYNQIVNTGYIGLRFGQGDNLIKNNLIDTYCATVDDGAGIYGYDSQGNIANRKIIGNIVLNAVGAQAGTPPGSDKAAEGIYIDDNTQDIEVAGNTVAWSPSHGLFVHNAQNVKVFDNTLFNNRVQFLLKSDRHGNAIRQVDIKENIYFSKEIAETVFFINSDANDLSEMGTLDQNYYVRPLYDQLPILAAYQNAAGVILQEPIGLDFWRSEFGYGQSSKMSPVQIDAYSIDGLVGGNRLPNETFDNNVSGLWCFSPYSDCAMNWTSSSPINQGGALKVSGPSPSRIGMNSGSVSKNKQYIVRFDAAASQPAGMEVYLMQGQSPWATISSIIAVPLETTAKSYELLISFPEDDNEGTLQFQFGKENTTYWLDNVQMYEAQVSTTQPDDFIRFEYNASTANRTISLDGDYVDGKGQAYSGSLTLGAYESVVLIKTDGDPIDPDPTDSDNDGVPDNQDQCPGSDDRVDVDNDGIPDGCDDCTIVPGTPCNDGDACTENDQYDAQCNCSGTLQDSDQDGICDIEDQCPGFDDSIDTDQDGIPDGCDDCVILPGTPCDDGSACTENDQYDAECNCVGTPADADNDGVCDDEDQCPGFDDRIDEDQDGIPDSCDDCVGMGIPICPSGDCDVIGDPIPEDEYFAYRSLSSEGVVLEDTKVVFKAGEVVKLTAGFRVRPGGDFQAAIADCESAVTGEPLPLVELREAPQEAIETQANPTEDFTGNPDAGIARQRDWKVYPNPISQRQGELNVEFYTEQPRVQLQIINQLGQIVGTAQPETQMGWNHYRWNISALPAGTYYLYHHEVAAGARKILPFVVMKH